MDSDHCILVLIVTQIQFQLESFSYFIHDANMYCKSFWINIKLYYFFTTDPECIDISGRLIENFFPAIQIVCSGFDCLSEVKYHVIIMSMFYYFFAKLIIYKVGKQKKIVNLP